MGEHLEGQEQSGWPCMADGRQIATEQVACLAGRDPAALQQATHLRVPLGFEGFRTT